MHGQDWRPSTPVESAAEFYDFDFTFSDEPEDTGLMDNYEVYFYLFNIYLSIYLLIYVFILSIYLSIQNFIFLYLSLYIPIYHPHIYTSLSIIQSTFLPSLDITYLYKSICYEVVSKTLLCLNVSIYIIISIYLHIKYLSIYLCIYHFFFLYVFKFIVMIIVNFLGVQVSKFSRKVCY